MTRILTCLLLFLLNCQSAISQEKLYPNEKYLMVLDVQEYWTDNSLSPDASEIMISSINEIVTKTNPAKVVYIKSFSATKVLSISLRGIRVDTIAAGDFDKNLTLVNDIVFYKTEMDAFATRQIMDFFNRNQAKDIIITGLLAENCVSHTVLGGLSKNFNIFMIPKAIGGKSEKSKAKVIRKLVDKGAKILEI